MAVVGDRSVERLLKVRDHIQHPQSQPLWLLASFLDTAQIVCLISYLLCPAVHVLIVGSDYFLYYSCTSSGPSYQAFQIW